MEPIRLTDTDWLILKLLEDQETVPEDGKRKPRLSLQEILDAIPGTRSIATIHAHMSKLEEAGYVYQPGKKIPRSRTITDAGRTALNGELYGKHPARNPSHFG